MKLDLKSVTIALCTLAISLGSLVLPSSAGTLAAPSRGGVVLGNGSVEEVQSRRYQRRDRYERRDRRDRRERRYERRGNRHVRACLSRYQSYSPRTNTYVDRRGRVRICRL